MENAKYSGVFLTNFKVFKNSVKHSERRLENMTCSVVFLTNFKVFQNLVKYCLVSVIYCLISVLSIETKTKEKMKKILKIHRHLNTSKLMMSFVSTSYLINKLITRSLTIIFQQT